MKCAMGNEPTRCCVGLPWYEFNPHVDPEPLDPAVISAAAEAGVEPHALDHHVEAVHGCEPHDAGYAAGVHAAVQCMLAGGCE